MVGLDYSQELQDYIAIFGELERADLKKTDYMGTDLTVYETVEGVEKLLGVFWEVIVSDYKVVTYFMTCRPEVSIAERVEEQEWVLSMY